MAKQPVDYQRQKVYRWEQENALFAGSPLPGTNQASEVILFGSPEIAFKWASWILQSEGVLSNVRLEYVPGRSRGSALSSVRIRIGEQYRAPRYLLHEVVHIILAYRFPYSDNGQENRHGPQFVQLLIDLRVKYCGDDRQVLVGSAYKHRLIVADENGEVNRLLALKAEMLRTGDKQGAKLVRRQIRALSSSLVREAAGSQLQARTPVVRRRREPQVYSVECRECYAKYQSWPANERCRKCGGSDLDWI